MKTALQGVADLKCAGSAEVASTHTSESAARRRAEFVDKVGQLFNTKAKILGNKKAAFSK